MYQQTDNSPWDVFVPITHPCIAENRYVISNNGRIKDLHTDEIVESKLNKHGIATCILNICDSDDCRLYMEFDVDELVAWEFCPENRDLKNEIFHQDWNWKNNYYKNLVWMSEELDIDLYAETMNAKGRA